MADKLTIPEAVDHVLSAARFWAPEWKARKLVPYLEHYGDDLYRALKARSDAERAECGIDEIKVSS